MAYTDRLYFELKIKAEEIEKLTDSDIDVLNSAISSADSLINTYLKNIAVTLPLSPVPEIIKQCSYDIAIFYLHDRIQYSEIPQWVKDKYNAAIDFLTKIAKGIITLEIETEDSSSENYQKPDENIKYFGSPVVMGRDSF